MATNPFISVLPAQSEPALPKGRVFEFIFDGSRTFPGTTRTIAVYLPAQYSGDSPACVYFSLDGLLLELPAAFDSLIHTNQMPVTIAIGVSPGIVESASSSDNPRYHRSAEFDALDGALARLLMEEVAPAVECYPAPGGVPIRLSRNPNDYAVGGVSTGGIGAFTAAWERPDLFRRVFTAIGTFVGMRGGDRYPVLVRKTEPKPIRIFIQDGLRDQWTNGPEVGDWWMSNQTMQRALTFAGYQVAHDWGEGAHDMEHATHIFPDAMRWLWKEWPQPVIAGESQNTFLLSILRPHEGWQRMVGAYQSAHALAVDQTGDLTFRDTLAARTWTLCNDGQLRECRTLFTPYSAMAYGADGRCYVADSQYAQIVAYSRDGMSLTVAANIQAGNMVVTRQGTLYVLEPGSDSTGNVWSIAPNGSRSLLDTGLKHPSAIALSPDGLWLAVAEEKTHWGYSYRIEADGTLINKQRFYWFHVPDYADDSGVGAWAADQEGRLYAATRMGVQVFDRNGRVRAILPVAGGEVRSLSFGGAAFDTLYVSCADNTIYRRKLSASGIAPAAAAIPLPPWQAG